MSELRDGRGRRAAPSPPVRPMRGPRPRPRGRASRGGRRNASGQRPCTRAAIPPSGSGWGSGLRAQGALRDGVRASATAMRLAYVEHSNIGERRRRRRQCGRGGAACPDLFRVLTESLLQLQGARRARRSGIGSERGGRSECGRTRNQRRATRAHVRHRRLMTNNGQCDRPRRAARTELEIDEQLRPRLETRLQQIIVVHHHKVSLALSEQRTRAGVAGALLVSGGEEQH